MSFYITKQVINLLVTLYGIYELNNEYKYLPKLLFIYFSIDIFLQDKIEGIIHHIISLFLSYQFHKIQNDGYLEDVKDIINLGIMMEYSNIFLFLKNILDKINVENMSEMTKLKHQCYKTITELGFIFCFIRYRIVENYLFLFEDNFKKLYTIFGLDSYFIYLVLIIFTLLNIYWFIIILKKIYKKLFMDSYINTDIYSEYCQKYISLLFPIYIFTKNMFSYKWYFYFDVIGVLSFSLNHFLFNNHNIRSIIYSNNSQLIYKWLDYYVFSINFFNLKSFFYILTMSIYLNNTLYYGYLFFSLVIHSQIFSNFKLIKSEYPYLTITNYLSMYEARNKIYFLMCINYFWFIFDNIITTLFFDNVENIIKNYLILSIIPMIFIIKPFYKQNNTLLLSLLFIQNIILTNSYR